MTDSVFITGANRGIGLELTRHFLDAGAAQVYAACRNPKAADALNTLAASNEGRVAVLKLDVNDERQIQAAVDFVGSRGGGLDLLINNAGIYPKGVHQSSRLGQLSAQDVGEVIVTNAVAALIVTQAFRRLLQDGGRPRVVMISSGMGLLARAAGDGYAYRMSKAAMNMAARCLALDANMSGIITISMNPGWVKTDMGGAGAALTPTESAAKLLRLMAGLSATDNGKLFQYDGGELAW